MSKAPVESQKSRVESEETHATGGHGVQLSTPDSPHSTAFTWPVRVYWEDTDAGGVVYYANYLKFLERARSEWLRALGIEQDELSARDGVVFVVRRVEADYLRPARFNDQLAVECRLQENGRASLTLAQTIRRDDETLLEARVQIACVEQAGFRPARIPAHVMNVLAR